ncbi:MAG: bifunctional phosphopantothenoylcysteine decarboxylase/phosphopantothenate--cysteine ligase CoaBC [Ignavibacteria bacterium]|nr:bifunctional phosphopantothenoylcysteine decarboxylase/phosphopantothenate--cysteine ligase CoaBC [Ignavibacteria bacterium]
MINNKYSIFNGKNIILGITGSIAAYKALLLIRELVKLGANVFPVLTPSATHFVTPLSAGNLSKQNVILDMFDINIQFGGAWHINLVHSCDMMVIAPCTASTLGKIANGICDNSLVTLATALTSDIPLLIAPAMDTSMYLNPSTQKNLTILQNNGAIIIPPDKGELSSGLVGEGRLPEIPVLLDYIETYLFLSKTEQNLANKLKTKLRNKKILITAGPTYEKIDDVRFIGNYSSGRMGYSLAAVGSILGADVHLVSGPTSLKMHHNVETSYVENSDDMYEIVVDSFPEVDIAILSAAVADFKPFEKIKGKIKKEKTEKLTLELIQTKDILKKLGTLKKNQILVGFALEEEDNGLKNAWRKMTSKGADMIVLNFLDKQESGFQTENNTITILNFQSDDVMNINTYETMSKNLCSVVIYSEISNLLK